MFKTLALAGAAIAATAAAAPASAQDFHHGGHRGYGHQRTVVVVRNGGYRHGYGRPAYYGRPGYAYGHRWHRGGYGRPAYGRHCWRTFYHGRPVTHCR